MPLILLFVFFAFASQHVTFAKTSGPAETCSEQSQCLHFFVDTTGADPVTGCVGTTKQVCIYWDNASGSCVKPTTATVSHGCSVGGVQDDTWSSGKSNAICQIVDTANSTTSVVAEFAVKDGNATTCGAVSQYQVNGLGAECGWTGQHCVAGGGPATECLWKVTVPVCASSNGVSTSSSSSTSTSTSSSPTSSSSTSSPTSSSSTSSSSTSSSSTSSSSTSSSSTSSSSTSSSSTGPCAAITPSISQTCTCAPNTANTFCDCSCPCC